MPHQPTRLPYGISYVKPFLGINSGAYILETGATPDVSMGTYFVVNFSSTTITNFDGGELGKPIYINCQTGGVVVIQNSAGGIAFNSIVGTVSAGLVTFSSTAGNITMLNGEVLEFMNDGTSWRLVGNRFVLSTQV